MCPTHIRVECWRCLFYPGHGRRSAPPSPGPTISTCYAGCRCRIIQAGSAYGARPAPAHRGCYAPLRGHRGASCSSRLLRPSSGASPRPTPVHHGCYAPLRGHPSSRLFVTVVTPLFGGIGAPGACSSRICVWGFGIYFVTLGKIAGL